MSSIFFNDRRPVYGTSYHYYRQLWQRTAGWVKWTLVVLVLLVVMRLLLPYALVWRMNHDLAQRGTFHGHVKEVSLALWRGGYVVHGLEVAAHSEPGADPALTMSVDDIDIAVDWQQLFQGRIRCEISLHRPAMVIRHLKPKDSPVPLPGQPDAGPQDEKQPSKREDLQIVKEEHWQDRIGQVIPFTVNALRIDHGVLRYVDESHGIDLELSELHGLVSDIAGGRGSSAVPATFTLAALTPGGGSMRTAGRVEPWALAPTFNLKASVEGVHLVGLNSCAKRLKGLTFIRGMFSAYAEMQAADGGLTGYVKPLFTDLAVAAYGDEHDNAATGLFWRAAAVVADNILPNDDTNALAARIPIKGRFDQPHTDTWTILSSVLSNAFLSPILPGFEQMGGFLSAK